MCVYMIKMKKFLYISATHIFHFSKNHIELQIFY